MSNVDGFILVNLGCWEEGKGIRSMYVKKKIDSKAHIKNLSEKMEQKRLFGIGWQKSGTSWESIIECRQKTKQTLRSNQEQFKENCCTRAAIKDPTERSFCLQSKIEANIGNLTVHIKVNSQAKINNLMKDADPLEAGMKNPLKENYCLKPIHKCCLT